MSVDDVFFFFTFRGQMLFMPDIPSVDSTTHRNTLLCMIPEDTLHKKVWIKSWKELSLENHTKPVDINQCSLPLNTYICIYKELFPSLCWHQLHSAHMLWYRWETKAVEVDNTGIKGIIQFGDPPELALQLTSLSSQTISEKLCDGSLLNYKYCKEEIRT